MSFLATRLLPTSASRLSTSACRLSVTSSKGLTSNAFKTTKTQFSSLRRFEKLKARQEDVEKYGVAGVIGLVGLHFAFGSQDDFYDHRYVAKKDMDDIASFYGGEGLMEIFCVVPFVGTIMMRGAEFDDEGNVHTTGIPGKMKVSMVFSDEEDENGQTVWFNKRERFKNTCFGYTIWDLVINYGVRRLKDGTIECYHQGEYFHGNVPPLSLIMLTVFSLHSRWVVWATAYHINNYAFTAETEEEEEKEHLSRTDILRHLFLEHVVGGVNELIYGPPPPVIRIASDDDDDDDDDDEEEEGDEEDEGEEGSPDITAPLLSVAAPESFDSVTAIENALDQGSDFPGPSDIPEPMDVKVFETLKDSDDMKKRIQQDIEFDKSINQDQISIDPSQLGRRGTSWMGGSTNNPKAYQMATLAAIERHQTRIIRRRTAQMGNRKATVHAQRHHTLLKSRKSLVAGERMQMVKPPTPLMRRATMEAIPLEAFPIQPVTEESPRSETPEIEELPLFETPKDEEMPQTLDSPVVVEEEIPSIPVSPVINEPMTILAPVVVEAEPEIIPVTPVSVEVTETTPAAPAVVEVVPEPTPPAPVVVESSEQVVPVAPVVEEAEPTPTPVAPVIVEAVPQSVPVVLEAAPTVVEVAPIVVEVAPQPAPVAPAAVQTPVSLEAEMTPINYDDLAEEYMLILQKFNNPDNDAYLKSFYQRALQRQQAKMDRAFR